MREENGRKYLFSLIPTDITVRTVFIVIMFLGIFIVALINPYNVERSKSLNYEAVKFIAVVISGLTFFTAFQIYINKGYRVSYDDEALYLRPDGTNWRLQYKAEFVMPYADIGELYANGGNMNLSPFEFIEIQRKGWDGEERFFLSRVFLRENQLKELLRFMHGKIPNKFPQDIIDYMNAEPGWIEQKQIEASD